MFNPHQEILNSPFKIIIKGSLRISLLSRWRGVVQQFFRLLSREYKLSFFEVFELQLTEICPHVTQYKLSYLGKQISYVKER